MCACKVTVPFVECMSEQSFRILHNAEEALVSPKNFGEFQKQDDCLLASV